MGALEDTPDGTCHRPARGGGSGADRGVRLALTGPARRWRAGTGHLGSRHGHQRAARRDHRRPPRPRCPRRPRGRHPGRGHGLPLLLDRGGDRCRGVLDPRRRRCRGADDGARDRGPRPPAADADAGGHGRRHPPGAPPRRRDRARRRDLLPGRHHPLARCALRRPAGRANAGVRHAREGVPDRRERHVRGRVLLVLPVHPRGPARGATPEGGRRGPQPEDAAHGGRGGRRGAAQLPPVEPRPVVGRADPRRWRRRRLRLRALQRLRASRRDRRRTAGPVLLRGRRLLRPQLRPGRLQRGGGSHPRRPRRSRPRRRARRRERPDGRRHRLHG